VTLGFLLNDATDEAVLDKVFIGCVTFSIKGITQTSRLHHEHRRNDKNCDIIADNRRSGKSRREENYVSDQQELTSAIRDAEKLHGHLGPFLVIGVRMGKIAKRVLSAKEEDKLRACARIPVLTPFSCILDGIQVATSCTVGNQRLSIENSKDIAVRFELEHGRAISIYVRREAVEELLGKISEGAPNEQLAGEIARMPEDRLFSLEKR
jgi:hypothetical protein